MLVCLLRIAVNKYFNQKIRKINIAVIWNSFHYLGTKERTHR